MLTMRRGFARIGWVLLAAWLVAWFALFAYGRSVAENPPPLTASTLELIALWLAGPPLAVFLLWRLTLWTIAGFWRQPVAPVRTLRAPGAAASQWNERSMALIGAALFAAYGLLDAPAGFNLSSGVSARSLGYLIGFAALGAIVGAVMARFLPRD